MKRLFIVWLVLVSILFVSATAFGAKEKKAEPKVKPEEVWVHEWVIPDLNLLTGGWAVYGEMMVWSMEIAVDEINKAGGIRGKPLRVIHYDAGTNQPELAISNMAKILDTKPLVILGPHGSVDAEAAGQLAKDEGVYSLEVTASYDTAKKYRPWANVWVTNTEQFAKTTAQKWIELNPDIKSVVMFITPELSTWLEQANHQADGLEAIGVKVLDKIPVTEAVDYGALAVRALKNKPDGFIPYTYPEAIVKITFELQKRGVKENRRFLYFHGAGTPEFWNLAGGKLDGAYIWSLINPLSDNPKWKRLAKAYEEKYGSMAASWVIPADYDAIYLIKACFEELNITGDPNKLKEERIKIRDWMNNVRNFEFAANIINIVDGEYQAPAWMFIIKNNALTEPMNTGLTWK